MQLEVKQNKFGMSFILKREDISEMNLVPALQDAIYKKAFYHMHFKLMNNIIPMNLFHITYNIDYNFK